MRSVVTVPLKVEGRLTGSLGVAAEAQGRYSNEEALRLQFAADRIALAVESARLGELERLRRGSLSFLVEASDLLAGTLDRDQTLALMAQMTVPTLATWCAVYTIADQASDPYLSYVLHEDEERIDGLKALLSKIAPPDPVPTPGARVWAAPAEAAHQAALRTSMRSLGLGEPATVSSGIGTTLQTAAAVGGETVVLPLVARNRVIGMLTLGKPSDEHFRQEILELAEDLSRRAALALDNARLYSERTAISQSLQRSLLPPELPHIEGVEVEVIYRAAGEGNEVGGDFYDLFPIRDGAYGFAIGDVCGTGPEAAAVTGLARHALRLLAREGFGGPAVLERLNSAILDEGARSRFLTLLYGELWPQEDGCAAPQGGLRRPPAPAPPPPGRHGRTGRRAPAAPRRDGRPGAVRADGHARPGRRPALRHGRRHRTPRGHPHVGRRRPHRRPHHLHGSDGRRGGRPHHARGGTLRVGRPVRRHGHSGDARPGPPERLSPARQNRRPGHTKGPRPTGRRPFLSEPPNGIEPLTFSLPWRRSTD